MNYTDYLGTSYSENSQEFNPEKAAQQVRQERGNLNIVLMGATGVGKSSLVNAIFGDNIVESGNGVPITQHLEKITIPNNPLHYGIPKASSQNHMKKQQNNCDLILKRDLKKPLIPNKTIKYLILRGYVLKKLLGVLNKENLPY